ncbi:hypothetical protein BDR26DRAFT_893553 [Obelidium mucronatum]|nr:hypothetical protein BDR26DRAFT_893553 [Obelidium mucronatum]
MDTSPLAFSWLSVGVAGAQSAAPHAAAQSHSDSDSASATQSHSHQLPLSLSTSPRFTFDRIGDSSSVEPFEAIDADDFSEDAASSPGVDSQVSPLALPLPTPANPPAVDSSSQLFAESTVSSPSRPVAEVSISKANENMPKSSENEGAASGNNSDDWIWKLFVNMGKIGALSVSLVIFTKLVRRLYRTGWSFFRSIS